MPVLILAGEEEFEVTRRARSLRKKLLDQNWASVNFSRLENPGISEIIDAACQLPFGPGNKIILVDRCDLFTKKRTKGGEETASTSKHKEKGDQLDLLEKAFQSVAANTYLIFACPYNFDSTLRTAKAASKYAEIEHFPKERYFVGSRNAKLETWCRKEAKHFGATIDDQAIVYLLTGLEADLRQISAEIAKAATYILPKTHISLAVVEELTPFHSHVFVLADKWITGHSAEALESLRELLSRQSGMPIIAMLQTMLSKSIEMKALCEKFNDELPVGAGLNRRELSLPDLVRKVAAHSKALPMVVEKDLKRIAKLSTGTLIAKKIELTRLEHLVKTGQLPDAHALEILLAK